MMNLHDPTVSLPDKSLLHPSALRLKDMKRGRRVVLFSTHRGRLLVATIVSLPIDRATGVPDRHNGQMIRMRHDESGHIGMYDLAALGVIPFPKVGWSTVNFLIDLNKFQLLECLDALLSVSDDNECSDV